ncbi:MAG: protein kinase [Polyangiaceae bacterium]|nr:protein kinase [Polyangiaceae bacterium]MCW5792547.1 protein kinase [Polyangiaceae bacterium]
MAAPGIDANSAKSLGFSAEPGEAAASSRRLASDDASFAAALAAQGLPRRFAHLTLLRQLARGGMGEVYLATTAGIEGAERPSVVKLIRRDHAGDRSFLARFLDEARIQAQLAHPGVAQILEAKNDAGGQPYVVVEYVEGRNLSEVRTRALQLKFEIGWPDAVAMAVTLCDALAHVHGRTDAHGRPLGIVHRDLSPQNIMVGYAGDLKLIDFGTARGENRRCQTVAGIVFAKPGYVAPEVANETPGGIPADIYAAGIILWELVAGRRFLQGDASEHLARVGAGQRNPPPLMPELGVPRELDVIIARMTAPALADRYANAAEAVTDLVRLLKQAPSLANGDTSVRSRIAHLMSRLYPSEPARSRAEFARLVAVMRKAETLPRALPASPAPPQSEAAGAAEGAPGVSDGQQTSQGASDAAEQSSSLSVGDDTASQASAGGVSGEATGQISSRSAQGGTLELVPEERSSIGGGLVQAHAPGGAASGREAPAPQPTERAEEDPQCLPGTRYRLVRRIASGAMGEVYEAEHLDLRRSVALKLLPADRLSEAELERFTEEARSFASLRHENLVTLYDFGVSRGGRPYYAMELLEGETLRQLLERDGPMPWREVARIGVQAARALSAAHGRGIIHRDITPGNLMLTRDGAIKLLDFGVAKLGASLPAEDGALHLIGTPEYMAPEQIRGETDERSDVYALGAVLYELACGRLPHARTTIVALLDQKLRVPPERLRQRAPTRGFPVMFDNTVQKSLANSPDQRYQSAEELREALDSALKEPALRQRRRRAIATGVVAALGIAVAGAAIFGASDPNLRGKALALFGQSPGEAAEQPVATLEEAPESFDESASDEEAEDGTELAAAPTPDEAEMGDQVDDDPSAAQEDAPKEVAQTEGDDASAELKEGADPVAEPTPVAASAPLLASAVSPSAGVAEELAQAQEMMKAGQRIKGFNQIRKLGRNHRKDPAVLKAWTEAAAQMKAWGEAHRVAKQWAELTKEAEARVHLARMQRAVGQREQAVKTLSELLKDHPDSGEARQLLQMYGGKEAIALK